MVIFHDAIRDAGYAAARNASRNNHASAWWDVIGCNSFSSRILVLAKTITECTDEQTTDNIMRPQPIEWAAKA